MIFQETPNDIQHGGTGANNAVDARKNLGVKSCGTYDILPVTKGGTGKTTAAEALKNLGGISWTKVWENANPTSAFANQTVTLNLSSYDFVMILFNLDNNNRSVGPSIAPVGHPGIIGHGNSVRAFKVQTNAIQFDAVSPDASVMIPYAIYGVKGVL